MRKSLLVFCSLALLVSGCIKVKNVERPEGGTAVDSPRHLIVDIQVNQEEDTRAVKTGWETGDKVYVFFDHFFLDYLTDPEIGKSGYSSDVQYLTLTYNGDSWLSAFADEALEAYLLGQSSGALTAVYYSDIEPQFRALHSIRGSKEEFYVNVKNGSNHPGFYLFDSSVSYTVENGKLSATLNMHPHERAVRFYVPGLTLGSTSHRFESDQVGINSLESISSENAGSGFQDAKINLSSASNYSVWPKYIDGGAEFYGRLLNSVELGQSDVYVIKIVDPMEIAWDTSDDVVYAIARNTALEGKDNLRLPSITSSEWVKVMPLDKRSGTFNGHDWELMGDGRKWARMNVGAMDKYDDGTLMTWEEASDFDGWGEGWRLPTQAEWETLLSTERHSSECFYTEINGEQVFWGLRIIYGTVLSRVVANEIFLPKTGLYNDMGELTPNTEHEGYYWSGTPVGGNSDLAYCLTLREGTNTPPYGLIHPYSSYRKDGVKMAVRLIVDERFDASGVSVN